MTIIDAPETHGSDTVYLLPIPYGVQVPRLADWAISVSMGREEEQRFAELALACIAISEDLANGHDGTAVDAERREADLLRFKRAMAAVTADIGPITLAVDPGQAAEIADAAHQIAATAQPVELDPAVIWDLLDATGHGEHAGWTHDSRWPEVVCACGDTVLRLTVPAPASR
ncbi:hypothetical protein [Planomonospora sp. ID82291]|uniref:hypothetical protein n=1 Tax=Planomonospora sp. ID82291 TaxID=2738136 RepID=UPI0018C37BD5|nr:hypothetical protein [Planomonospora sp. ID82291]MBG0818962.1 hypothetical protein [Planomonospora sp. ID82291]